MKIDLYKYKAQDFTCPCGWEGKGSELEIGEIFMDSAIVELDCPKCFEKIGSGQGNIVDEENLLKHEKSKIKNQSNGDIFR